MQKQPPPREMLFTLRDPGNNIAANNTINLGSFLFPGVDTSASVSAATTQYRLKSKYKNVNTGRVNTGSYSSPVWACPPTASFSYSISYSEFYSVDIEKVSILGIMFLNYDSGINSFGGYSNNTMSTYDTFSFITGVTNPSVLNTAYTYTCNGSNSVYNSLDYISLPFKVEP